MIPRIQWWTNFIAPTGGLLDRERNSTGDRIWRHRELVSGLREFGFHLRICHRFREVRADEARRDDCHAQLIAGLLAQTLGDGVTTPSWRRAAKA